MALGSTLKVVDETAMQQNITETKAYVRNNGAHTILNGAGTAMTRRGNLQFVGATLSDDSTNDKTVVTITGGGGGSTEVSHTTVFNADGSIRTTYDNGNVKTITFASNTITSVTTGTDPETKVTTFNADGSIRTVIS